MSRPAGFILITQNRHIAYFSNAQGSSMSVCIHEKIWPEGDHLDTKGGRACHECVMKAIE